MAVVEVVVDVLEAGEVTVAPAGVRPLAVAVLATVPASTSACVITYGAVVVQVVLAPGASVVAGQVVAPTLASAIATPLMVSDPVFVTRNAYATRSPASTRPLVLTSVGVPAVLVRLSVATADAWTAVDDAFEVTVVPPGVRAVTVAVLLTAPASTSPWVIV
ncbi:hypothetical protein GCM10009593_29400 [Microlunatus antarcticus]